jgi:hypothetical protein
VLGKLRGIGERKLLASGKRKGNTTFGSFRCRWGDNIKMDLREIGWRCVGGIDVAQDRDRR